LLTLLSGLLSSVLEADHAAVRARRALEVVQVESETDGLTTLLNRRGWDRYI
jgi:diguanylate cyclase